MTVKDKRRVIELETELNRVRHYLAAVTFMLSPEQHALEYKPPGFSDPVQKVLTQADAVLGEDFLKDDRTRGIG